MRPWSTTGRGSRATRGAPMPAKRHLSTFWAFIAAVFVGHAEAGATPVHDAIFKNDIAAIKALIASNPALLTAEDPGSGGSPLRIAALLGNVPIIEVLIAIGANVNATDSTGETALHAAAGNEGYPNTRDAILFIFVGPRRQYQCRKHSTRRNSITSRNCQRNAGKCVAIDLPRRRSQFEE